MNRLHYMALKVRQIHILSLNLITTYLFSKAVLVMYLTRYLAYSAQNATALYHVFLSILFLMSVFGAIIADSWLGKYKTVLFMFFSNAIGIVMLTLGSIPALELPRR